MTSRTLKYSKHLLLAAAAFILVLLLANLDDESYRPMPDFSGAKDFVNKPENAWYAVVGFNADTSENMHVMGYKIARAFEAYTHDKNDFLFRPDKVDKANVLKFVGDTSVLCQTKRNENCLEKIPDNMQAILKLKEKNAILYSRYRALIGYSKFHEDNFYIPAWADIVSLQRLHLNLANIEWLQGNKNRAAAMLSGVIAFNRMLLQQSELLINIMVATALYRESLQNFALIYSQCQSCQKLERVVLQLQPLKNDELCLKKSIYAELKYSKWQLEKSRHKSAAYRYFFQPAATFNRIFESYDALLQSCDMPAAEIPVYIEQHEKETEYTFPWYSYVYNPAGKYELEYTGGSAVSWSLYFNTMLDIEAWQRLIKLQQFIHQQQVQSANMKTFLARQNENLKNPFNNKPFQYDAITRSIFFTGHEGSQQDSRRSVRLR